MVRRIFRWVLALLMVGQGINHFIGTEVMVRMMPDYLPAPRMLVFASGVAEIMLGLMVLPVKTRRLAGWGILALLVAVFPANLQMALHPEQWPTIPAYALYLRLPFQLVFGYWAYATCLKSATTTR